jgi:hypothetical protein
MAHGTEADIFGKLTEVRGESHTSIIVDPADGRLPFTQAGLDLVAVEAR